MVVKFGLPPVQQKEGLGLLKIEFGRQYKDQLMIASMQLGEENITKNCKTNWKLHQLSASQGGKDFTGYDTRSREVRMT